MTSLTNGFCAKKSGWSESTRTAQQLSETGEFFFAIIMLKMRLIEFLIPASL